MKTLIYAVQDVKAATFLQPMFVINHAVAKRAFSNAINDEASDVGKNPEDFTMFCIGEYDSESGQITAHLPQFVMSGSKASIVERPVAVQS